MTIDDEGIYYYVVAIHLKNDNVRLVFSVMSKIDTHKMAKEDLIQEGIIGLITAIHKFDLNSTNKLSTFASWHILSAIETAIYTKSNTIRLETF